MTDFYVKVFTEAILIIAKDMQTPIVIICIMEYFELIQ